jgi:hypothetical protein
MADDAFGGSTLSNRRGHTNGMSPWLLLRRFYAQAEPRPSISNDQRLCEFLFLHLLIILLKGNNSTVAPM